MLDKKTFYFLFIIFFLFTGKPMYFLLPRQFSCSDTELEKCSVSGSSEVGNKTATVIFRNKNRKINPKIFLLIDMFSPAISPKVIQYLNHSGQKTNIYHMAFHPH